MPSPISGTSKWFALAAALPAWIVAAPAEATLPMRHKSLQGCVLGEFIVTSEVLSPQVEGLPGVYGVHEIADFDIPPGIVVDWPRHDGKVVVVAYRAGSSGPRGRQHSVTVLTSAPREVGDCPADIKRQMPRILFDRADKHARDVDPFADAATPLSARERAAADYALRLVARGLALEPESCPLHVLRAFILDRARRGKEATAALEHTRNTLRCEPIHERVAKHNFPDARLAVEEATDSEAETYDKATSRPR